LNYIFTLAPAKPGVFTIKPAEIKIANKTYSSEGFKIEVQPGKSNRGFISNPTPKTLTPEKKPFPKKESPTSSQ